jgi:hypothetical protein
MKQAEFRAIVEKAVRGVDQNVGFAFDAIETIMSAADEWVRDERDEAHQEGVWAGQESAG